jgi:hypothetical protein
MKLKGKNRGVALVMVLAAFAVVVTTCVTLAQLSGTARLRRKFDRLAVLADDLMMHVEKPILWWLEHEASSIALPPDVKSPEVPVLHDLIQLGELEYEIEITAWDQFGLAPLEVLRAGSPLRLTTPEPVLQVLDRTDVERKQPLGLDLFLGSHKVENPFPVIARRLFPVVFGAEEASKDSLTLAEEKTPEVPLSIAAFVATHNPAPGKLNVNTAPISFLDSVMRLLGRGGLEQIMEARSQGRLAVVGNAASSGSQRDLPELVATSEAWAFRVDLRAGSLKRSFWCLYVKDSKWRCVQRLAINC